MHTVPSWTIIGKPRYALTINTSPVPLYAIEWDVWSTGSGQPICYGNSSSGHSVHSMTRVYTYTVVRN